MGIHHVMNVNNLNLYHILSKKYHSSIHNSSFSASSADALWDARTWATTRKRTTVYLISEVTSAMQGSSLKWHFFVFSTMLFIFAFLRISSSLATFGFVSYPWLHFNTFGYCNGNNYWIMMHFTRARKGSQRGREGLVCLMQAMLLWKTRICSQGRLKQNKVKRLVYFWKYKFDESMAIYMYFVCLHANKIQGK